MVILALALLLAAPPAASAARSPTAAPGPSSPRAPAADQAPSPLDPAVRLDLARSLAADPAAHEEAVAVLLALLPGHPEAAPVLRGLLLDASPRVGWIDAYARAAEGAPAGPRRRLEAIRLRLQATVGHGARAPLASLERLWNASRDPRVGRERAAALLAAGLPGAAAEQLAALPSGEGAPDLEVLALVVAGRHEAARAIAEGLELPDALARAVADPVPARRMDAALAMGWPQLVETVRVLEGDARLDATAWERLWEARWRMADAQGAHAVWRSLHRAGHAERDAIHLDRLVAAGAWASAEEVARAAGLQDRLAAAREASPGDLSPVRARALFAAHPDQPAVVRAWALAVGREEPTFSACTAALARAPRDWALEDAATWAALQEGRPDDALAVARKAFAVARGPEEAAFLRERLASLHARIGEWAKERGEADRALDAYRVAVGMAPRDVGRLLGACGLLWMLRDLHAADATCSAAWELAPDHPGALAAAVRLRLQLGDLDGAARILAGARASGPLVEELRGEVDTARILMPARALVAAGDREGAAREYRRLLVLHPDDARIHHELADVLAALGAFEEADAHYAEALALQPRDPWLRLGRASVLAALGRTQEAIDLVGSVPADRDPGLAAERRRVLLDLRYQRASELVREGADREAFDLLADLLRIAPGPGVATLLGVLYQRHLQPAVALAFLTWAEERDPGRPGIVVGRAEALLALGRHDEAVAALDAARAARRARGLAPEPELEAAWRRVVLARRIVEADQARIEGRVAVAERILEDLAAADPGPAVAAARAALELDLGRPRPALERAREALALDPAAPRALGVLLAACIELERLDEAEAALDRAAAALPSEPPWLAELRALLTAARAVGEARGLVARGRPLAARRALLDAWDETGAVLPAGRVVVGGLLEIGAPRTALERLDELARLLGDPPDPELEAARAAALRQVGRPRAAGAGLDAAWRATSDPFLLDARARHLAALGRRAEALALLREAGFGPRVLRPVPRPDPLPVLPLPGGTRPPEDLPPVPPDRYGGPSPVLARQRLVARLSARRPLALHAAAGVVDRTGTAGETRLRGTVGRVEVAELPVGPVHLLAELEPVWIDDGVAREAGLGGELGAHLDLDGVPLVAALRVGFSPLGFAGGPTFTGSGELGWRPFRSLEAVLEAAREPVTDSLAAWAGAVYPLTGERYGRATHAWIGARVVLDPIEGFDLGVRGDVGRLDAIGLAAPVTRLEAMGWAGWTGVGDGWWVRPGAWVLGMRHDREIARFQPGEAGTFSPLGFLQALANLDGAWRPADGDLVLCAGGSLGGQFVEGGAGLTYAPGWSTAWAVRGGARLPLGPAWGLAADLAWRRTGADWREAVALFRLDRQPAWHGGFTRPEPIPAVLGDLPQRLPACRDRPTPP